MWVNKYMCGFDLHLNQCLWYLSAEPPTSIPGALQPTGQLAYSTGFQYPSPQQLFSEGVQGYQIVVPSQPGIKHLLLGAC